MKRLLPLFFSAALLLPAAGCVPSASMPEGSTVAPAQTVVVDSNILLSKSKPGAVASQYLSGVQQKLQKVMDEVLLRYKGKENSASARNEIMQAKAMLDRELSLQQQAVNVELERAVRQAVKNWRGDSNVVVMTSSSLLDYSKSADITSEVLLELDKMTIKLPTPPQFSVKK